MSYSMILGQYAILKLSIGHKKNKKLPSPNNFDRNSKPTFLKLIPKLEYISKYISI